MSAPPTTLGEYRLLKPCTTIQRGIYLAEHVEHRRRAVIRFVPRRTAARTETVQRLERDTAALAPVNHCNVVRLLTVGRHGEQPFTVEEHVDGGNLQDLVNAHGPLPAWEAARLIREAALALQYLQDAGLDHGDLKPRKILVEPCGAVKLLGAALGRFFYDYDDILTRPYDQTTLDTADFLAPECAMDSRPPDVRRDIYSLGCVFYYCLTGQPPYGTGTVAQKLIWHQVRQPPPVSGLRQDVPRGLLSILDRMIAKDRQQRYQTPREIARALDGVWNSGYSPESSAAGTQPARGWLDWFRKPEMPVYRKEAGHLLQPAHWPPPNSWPGVLRDLARAVALGEPCDFALHDALVEQGQAAMAEHFNRTSGRHGLSCCVLRALQAFA